MKKNVVLASLLAMSVSPLAYSIQKVIYGKDDRVEAKDYPNSSFREISRSVAGMVSSYQLMTSTTASTDSLVMGSTFNSWGVCSYERFSDQYTAPNCTGFLVGKDLLVTAGHCIETDADCKTNKWVFDYRVENTDLAQAGVVVKKSSVYECREIVSHALSGSNMNDFTLIRLDRPVVDRKPLSYRTQKSAPLKLGDRLLVIGHPSGLPLKIADRSVVRSIGSIYLTTDTDTYGGNSGSPVFNELTKEVEGILVRGETDFLYDKVNDCSYSNVFGQNNGRGEEVTLINNVTGLP